MTTEQVKEDLLERISNENLRFGEFIYTIQKEQESDFSSFCQYIKEISEKYGVETEVRAFPFFFGWYGIADFEEIPPFRDSVTLWVSVKRKGA